MHVIPDEGGSVGENENIKSSCLTYLSKDTGTDTSAYDCVQKPPKNRYFIQSYYEEDG